MWDMIADKSCEDIVVNLDRVSCIISAVES
jgi:hypothetical protein